MTQPFLHVARVLLRKRRPVNSVTSTEEEEAYDSRFGWKEVSGCTRDAVLRLARAWCYHTLALQLVAIKSDCRRCRRAFFYRQQRQLQITGLFFSVVSSLGIRREKRSKAIRYKTLCVSFKNRRQFIYVEVVLLLPTHFACFFLIFPAIWKSGNLAHLLGIFVYECTVGPSRVEYEDRYPHLCVRLGDSWSKSPRTNRRRRKPSNERSSFFLYISTSSTLSVLFLVTFSPYQYRRNDKRSALYYSSFQTLFNLGRISSHLRDAELDQHFNRAVEADVRMMMQHIVSMNIHNFGLGGIEGARTTPKRSWKMKSGQSYERKQPGQTQLARRTEANYDVAGCIAVCMALINADDR